MDVTLRQCKLRHTEAKHDSTTQIMDNYKQGRLVHVKVLSREIKCVDQDGNKDTDKLAFVIDNIDAVFASTLARGSKYHLLRRLTPSKSVLPPWRNLRIPIVGTTFTKSEAASVHVRLGVMAFANVR